MTPLRLFYLLFLIYCLLGYHFLKFWYRAVSQRDLQLIRNLLVICFFVWAILQYRIKIDSRQLTHLEKFADGNYVDLYRHPTDPNKIIKQLKFGKKEENWSERDHTRQKEMAKKDGWVTKGCFKCQTESCSLQDLIAWTIVTAGMWQSNLNKQMIQDQTSAIARISEIDPANLSWTEEVVESKGIDQYIILNKEDVKKQLIKYSDLLKKHNLRHYDGHTSNFGTRENPETKKKEIVTFDGEVLNPFFVWMQQMMMGHFFSFGETIPYKDFDAIQFNGLRMLTPIMELKLK